MPQCGPELELGQPGTAELVRPIYGLRKSVGRAGSPALLAFGWVRLGFVKASAVPLRRWCEVAGVRPAPAGTEALARGTGLYPSRVWMLVMGREAPTLLTLFRLSEALRVPVGDIAEACRQAVLAHRQGLAVERARKAAERR